jgi:hypothetical protein
MSNCPIGACWEAIADTGEHGKIWLDRRLGDLEVWRWSTGYGHGGINSDWNLSYRMCREEIPLWNKNGKSVIFRKVKS